MAGTWSDDSSVYRRDPLTGDVVLYAPGRDLRPQSAASKAAAPKTAPPQGVAHAPVAGVDPECPFCPGNEHLLPPIGWEMPDPTGGGVACAGGTEQIPDRARHVAAPGGDRNAAARRGPRESSFRPSGDGAAHLSAGVRGGVVGRRRTLWCALPQPGGGRRSLACAPSHPGGGPRRGAGSGASARSAFSPSSRQDRALPAVRHIGGGGSRRRPDGDGGRRGSWSSCPGRPRCRATPGSCPGAIRPTSAICATTKCPGWRRCCAMC